MGRRAARDGVTAMASPQYLRWPADMQTEAQAYVDAANAYSQSHFGELFAANWYPRLDVDGMWCAPRAFGSIAEPDGIALLRDDAETVAMLYWPEE